MKLLIVDDEEEMRDVIVEYSKYENYEVFEAKNGLEAIELVKTNDFDLIVMDIMMPKIDGFTTVKEIKKIKDIPIIMLSARSEEYDKLYGYELGIDDYITKPFSPRELMARIKVATSRKRNSVKDRYIFEGVIIDLDARRVTVDDEIIDYTLKEYEILLYLIKNKDIALSREKILNAVWGYEYFGIDRTVDTHIKLIRSKLGKYKDHIVTLRGMGYKFE